jgi:DNA-binding IclR family transcriptional regulator
MSSNDPQAIEAMDSEPERGGVQSVEVGMKVLRALADAGGEQNLSRIAEKAGMPSAKAHRYLVSLMRAGFVARDSKSSRYVLGPETLRIGLVALARTDVVEIAAEEMDVLREKMSGALLLAIWGANGPTIVRWIESRRSVTVNVRPGSNMPLLRSATGQVFAAFMPEAMVMPFIEREVAEMKSQKMPVPTLAQIKSRIEQTRKTGWGHAHGDMLPGVLALAAPLFNHQQELVGVITALGPTGFFDDTLEGPNAGELRQAANTISQRLGAMKT